MPLEQIARGFARGVVEQGQARLKVFLLAAAGGAILDHDALRDAGRFVDLFDQGLGIDQILILHDTRLFGDQRHGERIPFGNPVALLHLLAVLVHDLRTIGQLVRRTFPAFAIDDRDFTRARQRQTATALVDDRRHVAIFDRAVGDRFEVRLLVDLRRAVWKVRMVEHVPGSPIDCAAMTPTASPMLTGVPRARSRP